MSLKRIFGLTLLFLFFEVVVALAARILYPDVSAFLACLAMTGLALAVWFAVVTVTRILSRPRVPAQPAVPKSIPVPRAAGPADDLLSVEIKTLVEEANRKLPGLVVSSRGIEPTVNTVPLYLVIGAESSGKTAAILNSGLDPRLLAGDTTREGAVLPTRSCNLWFAENAVFVDLAGRLFAGNSEQWIRALRALSAQRELPRWKRWLFPRSEASNFRGAVLSCDIATLSDSGDPQRTASMVHSWAERLQSVGEVFRKDFPVYVLFTKCDTVPCFPEFFSNLSEPESRRVLGVSLPLTKERADKSELQADREMKRLTAFFSRLYMSLCDRRMVLLAREDDSAKKSMAYEFPRELKKVRGNLVRFLADVVKANAMQPGPQLRGFYFSGVRRIARTSTAQDLSVTKFSGAPRALDATVFFGSRPNAGGRNIVAKPTDGDGTVPKWTFLTDLFHSVVLADSAGHEAPRPDTRPHLYRNVAFASVGSMCLLFSMVCANSWVNNRNLLNSFQATVNSMQRVIAPTPGPDTINELETLRSRLADLQGFEMNGAPLSYRWGLYSGHALSGAMNELYFNRFRRLFMDPMLASFVRDLSATATGASQNDIYTELKAYRMITSGACKPDEAVLATTLLPVWTSAVPVSQELLPIADKQVQFYLAALLFRNPYQGQLTENPDAVKLAQAYLQSLHGPEKLVRAAVEKVNRAGKSDSLVSYASNYTEVINGPGQVQAAYTKEGWTAVLANVHDKQLASAGEACVIGETVSRLPLDTETQQKAETLYMQAYVSQWKNFVAAHNVTAFANRQDAVRKLRILSDNNRSPLLGLVYMVARNTNFPAEPPKSTLETGVSRVGQEVSALGKKVGQILPGLAKDTKSPQGEPQATEAPGGPTPADVFNEFQPVKAVVDPTKPDKWVNDNNKEYLTALAQLSDAIGALPEHFELSDQPKYDAAKRAADDSLNAARKLEQSFSHPSLGVDLDLKRLLEQPILYAKGFLPADPTRPLIGKAATAAHGFCSELDELVQKYPFNIRGTQEVTIDDLVRFFGPNGKLAHFSQNPDTAAVLQSQGTKWIVNPNLPTAHFPQAFLDSLERLSEFSAAVFADGDKRPHFDYIVSLDGTGNLPFELNIDGHRIVFNPKKPSIPVKLTWPPVTGGTTQLVMKSGLILPSQRTGPWSFFQLLQAADQQNGPVFTFKQIQFAGKSSPLKNDKGQDVTLQIRAEAPRMGNIFGQGFFQRLRCERRP